MLSETLTHSEIREAVVDLMPEPAEGGPEKMEAWRSAVMREVALYSSLSPELRATVDERLRAIMDLPPPATRRARDVAAAAERVGLGQSAMYGLLKRMSGSGPISGLIPGRRTASKPSAARDGFGQPIDGWIARIMYDQPDVPIAEVRRWIEAEIENLLLSGKSAPKAPAASALRERVHALRSHRPMMVDPSGFGTDLLVDQCHLSLSVGTPNGRRGASGLFIVDRKTTLILGAGMFVEKRAAFGIASALEDFRTRASALGREGLILPAIPATVDWIVPSMLVPQVSEVKTAAESRPAVDVLCRLGHSGIELIKLIGERLGPYRLLPRAAPDFFPMEMGEGIRSVDMSAPDVAIALEGLRFEVDMRNARMLRESTDPRDPEGGSDHDVEGYARVLEAIFEPVRSLGTPAERS